MTHHGTPLKTMGMDLKDKPITGAKMDFEALLRRSALIAVADSDSDPDGPLAVSADHLDTALDELLDTRNAMTRALLGGGRS